MQLFRHRAGREIGVVIDIGSASVLVSFIDSNKSKPYPNIIWSHREIVPTRSDTDRAQSAKNVMVSLMNAVLQLDTVGRKVLAQALPNHETPTQLLVTISAPWIYTVTKTISYEKDTPFSLTPELIEELERTAQNNIQIELKENELVSKLGLQTVSQKTLEILANGYQVKAISGQKTSSVALSRVNAVTQSYLTDSIVDIHNRALPTTALRCTSFMLCFYEVVQQLYPDIKEFCLVDITYEASEIGIVRDGVLRYCTHTPHGSYSFARDIADIYKIPTEEAYGYLTDDALLTTNTAGNKDSLLQEKFEAYQQKISNLFLETGDILAVPKSIILHCNTRTEGFFKKRILSAAAAATKGAHSVIAITEDLIERFYSPEEQKNLTIRHDVGVLISAQFFHTSHNTDTTLLK